MSHLHLVVSPKNLPKAEALISWIKAHSVNHIVSLETGTTGHEHYDCFFEVHPEFRTTRLDSLKRSLMKLYPEIPKNERKNIKFCNNKIDPNPLYGYGYASKEGNILSSTLDPFYVAEAIEYYEKHCAKVQATLQRVVDSDSKYDSIDSIARGCSKFIRNYFASDHLGNRVKVTTSTPIQWLIIEYMKQIRHRLLFTVYQKINIEKLQEFIYIQLVESSLDSPPPQPPPTSHNSTNSHPLLSQDE